MDVAIVEEPQKKIFRARKTMKISDRQQLESLHSTLSAAATISSSSSPLPSPPVPPLVNGKHPDEEQKETEKSNEKEESTGDNGQKEARPVSPVPRSPSPLPLSLSLSPSPLGETQEETSSATLPSSPSGSADPVLKESEKVEKKKGQEDTSEEVKKRKDEEKNGEVTQEKKEKSTALPEKEKENDKPKPDNGESLTNELPGDTANMSHAASGIVKDSKEPEEVVGMDTEAAINASEDDMPTLEKMTDTSLVESPLPPVNTTSSSSPSLSPSHTPESDQEVKEGFLVLSEEDESQGERDEDQEKEADKDEQEGEKMEVDTKKHCAKEDDQGMSPSSPAAAPPSGEAATAAEEEGTDQLSARKRTLSGGAEADEPKAEGGAGGESHAKRPRVESEELEAKLELKISGDPESRQRLEKVVQQLVAEQLRVLQLSVFDRSLQELRDRVEKIDCATKHQHSLNTLQAKITRLTKKFGAANQAKENTKNPQEVVSPPSSSATTGVSPCRTVRTMLENLRNDPQSQVSTLSPVSSIGPPILPKPLSTPTPFSSSTSLPATGLSPPTAMGASGSSTSVSNGVLSAPQNQPGALVVKSAPAGGALPANPAASGAQPVSLQSLLIQLPLAATSAQAGPAGVGLIPVSPLAGASSPSKAKATPTTTTYILQKTASSSPALPVPSSPSLPQITLARAAVYPGGGGGMVSVPSPGVSVSSLRASAVGASSSSSLPTTSTPAATGGQMSGAGALGLASATVMASKTDNQVTNRAADSTTAKTPAQVSRTSSTGAVIDLTEDDDDVQFTGVRRAPVQSCPSAAVSPLSASQRALGGLSGNVTMQVQPTTQTTVSVSQRPQALAPNRPPSFSPRTPSSSSSLSALPHHLSSPVGRAGGGARVLVGLPGAGGSPQATGSMVRSSQIQHSLSGPHLTVHHRPLQESPLKNHSAMGVAAASASAHHPISPQSPLPPLPSPPLPPARLPPEAAHSSFPQQPQLKLARVQSQNGIVLSWCVAETDRTCAAVDSYHLYAYHQDQSGPASTPTSQWKKIGEVKALPLPMACTLTQFVSGSKYYFAVRARDVYGRFGPFCEPQCTDVITPSSSS